MKAESPIPRGEIPGPADRMTGYAYAQDICKNEEPSLLDIEVNGETHLAARHFAEALDLAHVAG